MTSARPLPRRLPARDGRPRRGGWHAVADWRNWRLPVKLAAVTFVPVLFVIVLGAFVIHHQFGVEAGYQQIDQRVALYNEVRAVIGAAQRERNLAAVSAGQPRPSRQQLQQGHAPLDRATAALRTAVGGADKLDPVSAARWREVNAQLGRLSTVRDRWRADPDAAVAGYTTMIRSLLAMDRALASAGGDRSVVEPFVALADLDGVAEQLATQQALVLVGITRGQLRPSEVAGVHAAQERLQSRLADFRSVTRPADRDYYDRTVSGPQVKRRNTDLHRAVQSASAGTVNGGPALTVQEWNGSSAATVSQVRQVAARMADRLQASAAALRDSASDGVGLALVLLFCAVAIAAALVFLITRQLLRSIRILRTTAQQVAARQLPDAVAELREGRTVRVEVDPVPVATDEEIGQLARAFDAVHAVARKLAVEQAALRASFGNVFVNLSRRSQSLVQRQLRLIERLERDEEDPDQLATLFQLDHLATRMRRNNENLMVLSGSDAGNRTGHQQPAALGDLLRASVSEIEHYQRVVVALPPQAQVVGYAAGDLVRLIAELLDNATAFSAPDTRVTIGSYRSASSGALGIDIVDHGIGMREEDLADANERLAAGASADVPVSRRMGLFVVSRLAERHGIRVRLHGGSDITGLRAAITVPAELVVGDTATAAGTGPLPVRGVGGGDGAASGGLLPAGIAPAADQVGEPSDGHGSGPVNGGVVRGSGPGPAEVTGRIPVVGGEAQAPAPGSASGLPAEGLFTAASQASSRSAPVRPEKTPIFDEMVSAWFDPTAGAAGEQGWVLDVPAGDLAERWRFAADEGWRAVAEVSREAGQQAQQRTQAGLPKRTPRARLLPGSVATGEPEFPATSRNAERVRDRLARFQHGLHSGREGAAWPAADEPPADGPPAEQPAADEPAADEPAADGPPAEQPAADEPAADQAAEGQPADTQPDDQGEGGVVDHWQAGADEGWRAVAEMADEMAEQPDEQTSAGLPKRTPRARLLPGSVGSAGAAAEETADVTPREPESRHPGTVRDRLASFQRGVLHGRETVGAGVENKETE